MHNKEIIKIIDNLKGRRKYEEKKSIKLGYDSLYDYLDGSTIPHAVIIIGDYSYKSAFVADQEINMLACMTELMGAVKFK